MNNSKKRTLEIISAIIAWVIAFWIFKLFIALLTLGYVGEMISYPIVSLWELIFGMFDAEHTKVGTYFLSYLVEDRFFDSGSAVKELAIDYLRVGFLEMPFVLLIGFGFAFDTVDEEDAEKEEKDAKTDRKETVKC